MVKYSSEKDKCYGVVGMAVGMTIWNAEDMFIDVTIDQEGFDCMRFTPEFLFTGDPAISPKVSWQHRLKNYQIVMGITISNVLCRSMVLHKKSSCEKDRELLLNTFLEIGDVEYSLTPDECEGYFEKSYNYLQQVYSNSRMQSTVKDIAKTLLRERKMDASDIARLLSDIIS